MSLGEFLGSGTSITKAYFRLSDNTERFGRNALSTTGSGGVSYVAGKFNKSLYCNNPGNGNNNSYILGSDASYQCVNGEDFTISVWYKKLVVPAVEGHIASLNNSTSSVDFSIHEQGTAESAGKISFDLDITGTRQWTSSVAQIDSNWNKFTFTGTWGSVGSTLKVYKNGQEITGSWSNSTGVTPTGGTQLQIGGRCGASTNNYGINGLVDEFIWEKLIKTPSQIKKEYTYNQGRFGII